MKSQKMIEMDYQQAVSQAEELERIAVQLKNQAEQNFPGIIENNQSAWQGDNADSYIKKANTLQPRMMRTMRTSENLKSVAQTIRTVSKNPYEAELRAIEIAQERTY